MAVILPSTWITTGLAIADWYQGDAQWRLLSDRAHEAPSITRKANMQHAAPARGTAHDKRRAREGDLLDAVLNEVQNDRIDTLIMARSPSGEWVEHVLPDQYLVSPQFRAALLSGQAGRLRLTGSDVFFADCALCFRSVDWKKWKSGSAAKSIKIVVSAPRQFSVAELNKHFKDFVQACRKAGRRVTEPAALVEMRRRVPGVTRAAVRELLRNLHDRARRGRPRKIAKN
jgi:hypothetical protein